jgi:GT2 family glycosyltransferase
METRVMLAVPVMYNFKGFTELMHSVDISVRPFVIPNWEENIGVSKAWNNALDESHRSDAEVLIISNDDVVFEPGCLEKLVAAITVDDWDLATAVNTRDFPRYEDCAMDEPDYACFAVDPIIFRSKYGYFDENFTPAYFEDNDMAYRISRSGGKQIKLPLARMYHKGSQTQFWNGERVVSHEMFRRNEGYYMAKWGGMPGKETYEVPFNDRTKQLNDWKVL